MALTASFRKSSKCSADSPQCVEVALRHGSVIVRDSKTGSTLQFSPQEWHAFTTGVRDGELGLPSASRGL
jgi:hypothetical protein